MPVLQFFVATILCVVAGIASPARAQHVSPESSQQVQGNLRHKYAQSGDMSIHYLATGDGPLVVLMHGFPDTSATWSKLISELADSYRVVAIDSRGTGLSSAPVGVADYAMPHLLDDISAVMAAEGRGSATLIGHDMGGAVAWRFALTYPHLVDGLAVLSMPHPAAYAKDLAANPEQRNANQYFQMLSRPDAIDGLSAEMLAGWVSEPGSRKAYVDTFERSGIAGMLKHLQANDPAATGSADAGSLAINLPLLLIHGQDDGIILPSGHDHTWDYVSSDSAMLRVPGAGHFVHHDAPDVVNGAIRSWLDLRRE